MIMIPMSGGLVVFAIVFCIFSICRPNEDTDNFVAAIVTTVLLVIGGFSVLGCLC